MKLVQITGPNGSDMGSNWFYRDGDLWFSTDAFYEFVIGEEISDDGMAIEYDISRNLSNRSTGSINGYDWAVIDADGIDSI